MVIFITGPTHVGKTNLSQRIMEKYKIPYVCQDHIKMGLIRSKYTDLTPQDDDLLTDYLWPVTREMAKTAIENKQSLIIEGGYFPFDWKNDFNDEYLRNIRYICLCFSDNYIQQNFHDVKKYSSCIENRLDDEYCSVEMIRGENQKYINGCISNKIEYVLIDNNYKSAINKAMQL